MARERTPWTFTNASEAGPPTAERFKIHYRKESPPFFDTAGSECHPQTIYFLSIEGSEQGVEHTNQSGEAKKFPRKVMISDSFIGTQGDLDDIMTAALRKEQLNHGDRVTYIEYFDPSGIGTEKVQRDKNSLRVYPDLGDAAMKFIVEEIKNRGSKAVFCVTSANNLPMRGLLLRHGFRNVTNTSYYFKII